ncbi:YraN family protein [Puia sp. P3]|uniref:YraN family protein n=1 Tax=Puia sp. P3 TaxID=3423952 RepID=UPI003D66957B
MALHILTGTTGEDLAAEWLTAKGFAILTRNWRYGRYEIDIIASRNSVLHFIEVKSRNSTLFGNPEESVSRKKLNNIMQGAAGLARRIPRPQKNSVRRPRSHPRKERPRIFPYRRRLLIILLRPPFP